MRLPIGGVKFMSVIEDDWPPYLGSDAMLEDL
jgi:hypothetical protein